MPRGLSAQFNAALDRDEINLAEFVSIELSSGTVRLWDGAGVTRALGQSWNGLGEFGQITGLKSDGALRASSISIDLFGIPREFVSSGVIAETRSTSYRGAPVSVYWGLLDAEFEFSLVNPFLIWKGFADAAELQIGNEISFSLPCDSLASWTRRINGNRMTTASHNQRLGNPATPDLFFDVQSRLANLARAVVV